MVHKLTPDQLAMLLIIDQRTTFDGETVTRYWPGTFERLEPYTDLDGEPAEHRTSPSTHKTLLSLDARGLTRPQKAAKCARSITEAGRILVEKLRAGRIK